MAKVQYSEEFKAEVLAVYADEGRAAAVSRFAHDQRGHPAGNTIKRWADRSGVVCAHTTKSETEAANNANETRRLRIREKLALRAEEMLDRMGESTTVFMKDGTPVALDRPPAPVLKDLATTAAILIDKLRLEAGEATGRQEVSGVNGGPIEFATAAQAARERLAGGVSRIAARQRAEGVSRQPE